MVIKFAASIRIEVKIQDHVSQIFEENSVNPVEGQRSHLNFTVSKSV